MAGKVRYYQLLSAVGIISCYNERFEAVRVGLAVLSGSSTAQGACALCRAWFNEHGQPNSHGGWFGLRRAMTQVQQTTCVIRIARIARHNAHNTSTRRATAS